MVVKGKKTKNPPVLSHEFVIQNHADIVACVAMVFVVGLMFQISSPAASVFIALHHNVTVPTEIQPGVFQDVLAYTQGPKDIPAIFFYLLISVVMHAIIQEYLLDKVNKKLHLSKIKHAKFNESGQLLAFYITSIVWAGDIVLRYLQTRQSTSESDKLFQGKSFERCLVVGRLPSRQHVLPLQVLLHHSALLLAPHFP